MAPAYRFYLPTTFNALTIFTDLFIPNMKAKHLLSSLVAILILHSTVSAQFFNDVQVGYHISGGVSNAVRVYKFLDEERRSTYENHFSYAAGVDFSKPIFGTFSVHTGLTYSIFKTRDVFKFTLGDMTDPRKGFIYQSNEQPNNSPDEITFYDSFHFLQVPIGIHGIQRISKSGYMTYGIGIAASYMVRFAERQSDVFFLNQDPDPTKWNAVPMDRFPKRRIVASFQAQVLYTTTLKNHTIKAGPIFEQFLRTPWETEPSSAALRPYRLALQLVFAPNFSTQ